MQRIAALRVVCAYRLVSEKALLVVASMIPIDLFAKERAFVYKEQTDDNKRNVRNRARERSVLKCQERSERDTTVAQWTHTLIPVLSPWYIMTHDEVSLYLCQFLTAHGHFNRYLYRKCIKGKSLCNYCCDSVDDAYHTFFVCERWVAAETRLRPTLAVSLKQKKLEEMVRWWRPRNQKKI